MPHITLTAEKIGELYGLPITNSLLTTWLVMAILVFISFILTRKISIIPSHRQAIAEIIIGGLYDFFHAVVGKHIKTIFPLVITLFLFIISANWIGLLPGIGTIGIKHGESTITPIFRPATADINTTLALAVTAVLAIQYFGFSIVGTKYISRFFNLRGPINFFVGILELFSEFAKIISFAFRLFGNIFAGEVLLTVIAFLMPVVIPLPFLAMELFVGFIQALVFSMLTAVFLNVALSHGEH